MTGYIFVAHDEEETVKFLQGQVRFDALEKDIIVEDEDFEYYETRVFDFINVECNILIDKYEEETLECNKISKAIEIVKILLNNSDDQKFVEFAKRLLELFIYAKENGKDVEFKF